MPISLSVHANAGIPMLILVWPAFWLGLIPVIVIEAFVGSRTLDLNWKSAWRVSAVGNLWSTFIGIPVVWLLLLLVEMLVGMSTTAITTDQRWHYILFPLMAAWLFPTENVWIIYFAFVFLAIPFCLASIWIELKVARRMLPDLPIESLRRWIRRGNVWSYLFMIVSAMAYPLGIDRNWV